MQSELIEAMKTETFYEGDNPLSYANEDHGVSAMMDQEKKIQDEEEDKCQNDVLIDYEGLPLFAVSSVVRKHAALVFLQ